MMTIALVAVDLQIECFTIYRYSYWYDLANSTRRTVRVWYGSVGGSARALSLSEQRKTVKKLSFARNGRMLSERTDRSAAGRGETKKRSLVEDEVSQQPESTPELMTAWRGAFNLSSSFAVAQRSS